MNMICINILGNVLKKNLLPFLAAPHFIQSQQTRNTYILKRRTPPILHRKGKAPRRLRSRHFVYELVENADLRKRPPINLILTKYVEGFGDRGDRITMPAFKAYDKMLLPGLAVYDIPENAKKLITDDVSKEKRKFSSPFAERAINFLRHFVLHMVMNNDKPWTLEAWHVRSQFRERGIHMKEECITMPAKPITGPNHDLEDREFYVIITVNKTESTPVRCRIHHRSKDPNIMKTIPTNSESWYQMVEPIFPEDKAVLDQLPVPYIIERERNKNEVTEDE